MPKKFANRIKELRVVAGLTQSELAEMIGTSKQNVSKMENAETLKTNWISKISQALNVSALDVAMMDSDQNIHQKRSANKTIREAQSTDIMPEKQIFTRDMPVRGAAFGSLGANDSFFMEDDPVDFVERPEKLKQIQEAYALNVIGSSMEPAFKDGDLIFVHPGIHPSKGDYVVIQEKLPHKSQISIYIKKLESVSEKKIKAKQFNPEADLEFNRDTLISVHKVLSMREIFS